MTDGLRSYLRSVWLPPTTLHDGMDFSCPRLDLVLKWHFTLLNRQYLRILPRTPLGTHSTTNLTLSEENAPDFHNSTIGAANNNENNPPTLGEIVASIEQLLPGQDVPLSLAMLHVTGDIRTVNFVLLSEEMRLRKMAGLE